MTAQKGYFNRVPSQAILPIDAIDSYQPKRARQRLVSALIALAGSVLFLSIIALIMFLCWKGVHGPCETCSMEIDQDPWNAATPDWDSGNGLSAADDDNTLTSTVGPVVTTIKIETSDRAPPRYWRTTPASAARGSDRLPWYARLPLIGWMFRPDEIDTSEEIIAKLW